MKFATLILGAALASAAPALALAACDRPSPPSPVDGASITRDQLVAAKSGVMDFMAASDKYQDCILADVTAQRTAAKKSRTKFDPAVQKAADDAISANQADKEQAGAAFNAAAKAYRSAHPS